MITWRLKKGTRVRPGHPWVFTADIDSTGKNFVSGSPVTLQDAQGGFVAHGYGNPESAIAFRAVSFVSQDTDYFTSEYLRRKVLEAWTMRVRMGFKGSFRMVFSESDSLPGLIVDYYVGEQNGQRIQVLATQILTAGMQRWMSGPESFFQGLVEEARKMGLTDIPDERTAVVLRNDVRSREKEGLKEESPRFIKSVREADFTNFPIELNAATGAGVVRMNCDLFLGQKTGFFLDQTQNIQQVCRLLENAAMFDESRPIRVLDLCCYVGHWSTQIARTLRSRGLEVEATQVDISAKALAFARGNAEREGAIVKSLEGDMFKILTKLGRDYDIVIADPPAFIKSKKDVSVGQHAYTKMNSQALRVLREGGLLVSCSCSGLLTEDLFKDSLRKAFLKTGSRVQCLLRGGPAPDHPGRLEFSEGMYLKMFTHRLGSYTEAGAGGGDEGLASAPAGGTGAEEDC